MVRERLSRGAAGGPRGPALLRRRMRAVAGDDAARARRPQGTRAGDGGARGRRSRPAPSARSSTRARRCRTYARQQMSLTPEQERQLFDAGVNVVVEPALRRLPLRGLLLARSIGSSSASATRAAAGASAPATSCCSHETDPFDMTIGARLLALGVRDPAGVVHPGPRGRRLHALDGRRAAADRHLAQLLPGLGRAEVPLLALQHGDAAFHPRRRHARSRQLRGTHASTTAARSGSPSATSYVFFAFELTLAGVSGHGDVKTAPIRATARRLAHDTDISGFIIYPAFGLMGEF